jgi:hypothetical protein
MVSTCLLLEPRGFIHTGEENTRLIKPMFALNAKSSSNDIVAKIMHTEAAADKIDFPRII